MMTDVNCVCLLRSPNIAVRIRTQQRTHSVLDMTLDRTKNARGFIGVQVEQELQRLDAVCLAGDFLGRLCKPTPQLQSRQHDN
jgi:hypothetical protein